MTPPHDAPLRFRLSEAPRSPPAAAPRWRRLLDLAGRLPGGLIHAERISLVPAPPSFLTPLAEGSAWYPLGSGLVVVADPQSAQAAGILASLVEYRELAGHVGALLEDAPAGSLDADTLQPDVAARLAHALEASPDELQDLDGRAPGLRRDVAWMSRRDFDPEIWLHPTLSPEHQADWGCRIAEQILARIPAGRFFLLVADGTEPVEVLSPFATDLGHTLYQWGAENPDALPIWGLADALAASRHEPQRDLASLVAVELTRRAREAIRVERRAAEASQGLWLEDGWGATWGVADLARLDAPDPSIFGGAPNSAAPTGVLAVVCGGSAGLREAAAARLAESGRLESMAMVAGAAIDGETPVIPEALVWEEDAERLELGIALAGLAGRVGIEVRRMGALTVDATDDAAGWSAQTLARWRKARITGAADPEVRPILIVAPGLPRDASPALERARARLDATRLAVLGLLEPELGTPVSPRKSKASGREGRVSRRFRA